MNRQSKIGAMVLLAGMTFAVAAARAHDETKYPDFGGQWSRGDGGAGWDETKKNGLAQNPPLTPEYQAIFAANVASVAAGSEVYNDQSRCMPSGFPRMMIAYEPLEVIVTGKTTYVRVDHLSEFRRIYTDGRDWPAELEPTFAGYSIGKWLDTDNDGTYDTLEIETRHMRGPRLFDSVGIPLAADNETVVKERIYLDKADPETMHNVITIIDHAFTQPWTVDKHYSRVRKVVWYEDNCNENNHHIVIGKENYFMSGDGYLMPAKKDQAAPDLRYFKRKADAK